MNVNSYRCDSAIAPILEASRIDRLLSKVTANDEEIRRLVAILVHYRQTGTYGSSPIRLADVRVRPKEQLVGDREAQLDQVLDWQRERIAELKGEIESWRKLGSLKLAGDVGQF